MGNKKIDWRQWLGVIVLGFTFIVMTVFGVLLEFGFFEPLRAMFNSFFWTCLVIGFVGACFFSVLVLLYFAIIRFFSFIANCFKYGLPNSKKRQEKLNLDLTYQYYWWPALRDRFIEEENAKKNAPASSVYGSIGKEITENMIVERLRATEEQRVSLVNYIKTKLLEKKITASECYTAANLTRQTFWKIMQAKTESPKTGTLIAIAVALKLSIEETREMLAIVGRCLSRFNKAEMIAELFIEKGYYDVDELDLAINKFAGDIKHLEELR